MQESDFWDDNDSAQKIISECNDLKSWTVPHLEIKQSLENVKALLPECIELQETEMLESLKNELKSCDKILAELEVKRMLSGEMDSKNCFLSIISSIIQRPSASTSSVSFIVLHIGTLSPV
jgi:peptide chain release factor 2